MDLALELGCSVAHLTRSMSEREFGQWQAYAAQKALPARRLEVAMANLAYVAVQLVAGKGANAKLSDFLVFDRVKEIARTSQNRKPMTSKDGASMFKGMTGGRVHKLGQKSRRAPRG